MASIIGDPGAISATATAMITAAEGYIVQLGQESAALQPPNITPIFPVASVPPAISVPPVPPVQPVLWTSPSLPQAFTQGLDISALLPPPFTTQPPSLDFGTQPGPFSVTSPISPPIQTQFTFPTINITLPTPPSLLSLDTFAFDGVTLPTPPSSNVPQLNIPAPSIIPYVPGAMYTSQLLTDMRSALDARINSGTNTGLPAPIEQAIWDRGREREARASQAAIMDLEKMEGMGFMFPPGVYLDARLKIQTEMGYTAISNSRDISVEQAKLVQKNIVDALNSAVMIEGKLIDYTNSVEQRLFESTKYATEAGISIYNAGVEAYKAFLQAYGLEVEIYKAQIQGQLAVVQVFEIEMRAEQIKAEINTALVQQYKTEVDAALANVEIYKAQLNAVEIQANIQKLIVEIFGEQVKAYAAQVGAYTAGVEAYRATVEAQGAKEAVFKTQAEVYGITVDAAIKEIDAQIEEYKAQLASYEAQLEAYKAAYTGEAAQATAITEANKSIADIYVATVTGTSSYNDTLTKQWQVAIDEAERITEIGVSAAKANADLYISTRSLALDAAKVGAQVTAQLGAAAINAISWSSSYSASIGSSYTKNNSTSMSTSYSYNHNYDQSISA